MIGLGGISEVCGEIAVETSREGNDGATYLMGIVDTFESLQGSMEEDNGPSSEEKRLVDVC